MLGADQFGYWHNLMVIGENRLLFDPLPPRDVNFCIIDAEPNDSYQGLINSFEKLKKQKYKKWKAIYFMNKISEQNR